jgi:hypothetical protein
VASATRITALAAAEGTNMITTLHHPMAAGPGEDGFSMRVGGAKSLRTSIKRIAREISFLW